jgi:hypothetical protein
MWGPKIRHDTYPEESIVLLPQVNVAFGALTHKRTHTDMIRDRKGGAMKEV